MNNLEIVACISSNGGLGYHNGDLLFRIKEDLKRFKEITSQGGCNIVVMGRKTFESIVEMNGKPLPNRINVVLTRNVDYKPIHGEFVFHDIKSIINHCETLSDKDKKVFIVGGEEVYRQLISHVDRASITHVNKHVEDAEVFFPSEALEKDFVAERISEDFYNSEYDAYYRFVDYKKKDK